MGPIFPFLREVVIGKFPDLRLSVGVVAVGGGTGTLAIFEGNAESSFFVIRQSPQFLLAVGEGARLAFLAQALHLEGVTLSKSGHIRVLK